MGKWFQKNFLQYTPGTADENGRAGYVYSGERFRSLLGAKTFRVRKAALAVLCVLTPALCVFMLSQRVPSNSSRLVMLPAAAGFIAMLVALVGAVYLLFSGQTVERWRYQIMHRCLRIGGLVWAIAPPVAAIVNAVVLVFGDSFLWAEVLLCAGYLALGAAGFAMLRLWKKIGYAPAPANRQGEGQDAGDLYDDRMEDIKDAFSPRRRS
jgi:hypothetical protein